MFKIFKRVKALKKKVEELYDVVGYLLDEDDSNRELIEEYEERIKSIENLTRLVLRINKDDENIFPKFKREYKNAKDTDELSKFKYDETEC